MKNWYKSNQYEDLPVKVKIISSLGLLKPTFTNMFTARGSVEFRPFTKLGVAIGAVNELSQ